MCQLRKLWTSNFFDAADRETRPLAEPFRSEPHIVSRPHPPQYRYVFACCSVHGDLNPRRDRLSSHSMRAIFFAVFYSRRIGRVRRAGQQIPYASWTGTCIHTSHPMRIRIARGQRSNARVAIPIGVCTNRSKPRNNALRVDCHKHCRIMLEAYQIMRPCTPQSRRLDILYLAIARF